MKNTITSYDLRRKIAIPGDYEKTLGFCVDHFFEIANEAIAKHKAFYVALSGGSTPKALFQRLALEENRNKTAWDKFHVFWSDERCVPPDHAESNYKMAQETLLKHVPIKSKHIYRMEAETDLEENAEKYDRLIQELVPSKAFDLMMLGVGDDGHTASLFPATHGLHTTGRLAIANYIPQKNCWRMSLTFDCINRSHHIAVYALGPNKAEILQKVLAGSYFPDRYPAQRVGVENHPALWIADKDAAKLLEGNKSV